MKIGLGMTISGFGYRTTPKYMGPVASRTWIGSQLGGTLPYMVRTTQKIRAPGGVDAIKMGFANFSVVTGETMSGGVLTVKASLDLASVRTQVLFGGSPTGVADAATPILWSDLMPWVAADGAAFQALFHQQNTVKIPYMGPGLGGMPYIAGGDAIEQTATDKTMSGTITDGGIGIGMWPCAIWGYRSGRCVGLLCDSRGVGATDTPDASGNLGEIQRSIEPLYAIQPIGRSGESMTGFLGSSTIRRTLLAPCTTIIDALGINDIGIVGAIDQATFESRKTSLRSSFAQTDYWGVTMPPFTSGAWTLADRSDQTVTAGNAVRTTANTWLRALAGGLLTGVLDPAITAETAGKWNAPGWTGDGAHELAGDVTKGNKSYVFSIG